MNLTKHSRHWASLLLAMWMANAVAQDTKLSVSGYVVEGDNPLSPAETQSILAPYTGEDMNFDRLQAAAAALESELKRRGQGFLQVVVPPQEVNGRVTLRVLAFRVGAVKVNGGTHTTPEQVFRSLPSLAQGQSPNLREMARELALASDNPSRQLDVSLAQGKAPDSVDANIAVRDAKPWSVFAMLNNTGTDATGDWRLGVGMQHANLFELDHVATATYTSSPDHWSNVKQYGLHYRIPFYAQHGSLSAYFTRSDTNSGTVAQSFEVSGRGEFVGLSWTQMLLPLGSYAHRAVIGVEDRFFRNDVSFGGVPIGTNVRSRPLTLHYEGRFERSESTLNLSVDFASNLKGGGDNNDAAYLANRAGANASWQAWRAALEGNWHLGSWFGTARVRGQHSSDALIPGEQFALGGASWVRGLPERDATGDTGYVANIELTTPELAQGMHAVLFADGGTVWTHQPVTGQNGKQAATSAGAGLRWQLGTWGRLSLDLARVLNGTDTTSKGHSFTHAALFVRL